MMICTIQRTEMFFAQSINVYSEKFILHMARHKKHKGRSSRLNGRMALRVYHDPGWANLDYNDESKANQYSLDLVQ